MVPIIGDIIKEVGGLVSEFIPDADKRAELQFKFAELADRTASRLHDEAMAQVEVNKVEAAHSSIFVAGWRPFLGWVSGFGLAWTFVLAPMVEWISRLCGWQGKMPELDTSQLMTLVLALLGLGTMRTIETVQGVARSSMKPQEAQRPVAAAIAKAATPAPPAEPPKRKGFKIKLPF